MYNVLGFGDKVGYRGVWARPMSICSRVPQYTILYLTITNCIQSHLASCRFFLASDSEPDVYVSGEAGHYHIMLARYRSPGKDHQIAGSEWNLEGLF